MRFSRAGDPVDGAVTEAEAGTCSISLSDFDPTSSSSKFGKLTGLALGGPMGMFAPRLLGRTRIDPAAVEAEMALSKEAQADYDDWMGRWASLDDPGGAAEVNAKRRGDLYTGEVDRGMYDAGRVVARNATARGMGDSGYAAAGQQGVIAAAAGDRIRARERAWQESLAEQQALLGGELPAMSAKYGIAFKPYELQAMMSMLQAKMNREQDSDLLGGLLSLGGLLAGGKK